jgi:hypothetical protein
LFDDQFPLHPAMVHPAYLCAFEFVRPGLLRRKIEHLVLALCTLPFFWGLSKASPEEDLSLLPSGYKLSLMP